LSADEFKNVMMSGHAMPARSFLITFDDGYESIRTTALDILQEFDFKAISFLSTQFVRERQGRCNDVVLPDNGNRYLSWE
jgi:peptidoglycan/xylan/chitin deacetylase (PgdA/CDA1 family)